MFLKVITIMSMVRLYFICGNKLYFYKGIFYGKNFPIEDGLEWRRYMGKIAKLKVFE